MEMHDAAPLSPPGLDPSSEDSITHAKQTNVNHVCIYMRIVRVAANACDTITKLCGPLPLLDFLLLGETGAITFKGV
eukprot:763895-Amphidinium_carterae.1